MSNIKLIVLAGPSGVGKTTIVKNLLQDKELKLKQVVSLTTRNIRQSEVEGKDYYFVDYKTYANKLTKKELIQHDHLAGTFYGLEKSEMDKCLEEGKIPLFAGFVNEADFLRKEIGAEKVLTIKIFPESKKQLIQHLSIRDDGGTNAISERLSKFNDGSNWIKSYGYSITNHENKLNETIAKIKDIIVKETTEKLLEPVLEQEDFELA